MTGRDELAAGHRVPLVAEPRRPSAHAGRTTTTAAHRPPEARTA
ncbi:hypothetical protein [Ornithinimicrobium sp. W1665]